MAEANETFTVQRSAVQDALLGDGVGVGTIYNDDGAAVTSSATRLKKAPEAKTGRVRSRPVLWA